MYLLSKKTFAYVFFCLLVTACLVQGFYNYHNWKVRQWCDYFGFEYTKLGGPPKSWEWPWNWSMVSSLYISRSIGPGSQKPHQFPEPSSDDVRNLIDHARHVPRLRSVGISIPVKLTANDVIKLKNQKQIGVYTTTQFTDEEMKFIRDSMPNTIVFIKFVE